MQFLLGGTSTGTESLFPPHESDLHELGESVFLFAWNRQYEHSLVSDVLGNQRLLEIRSDSAAEYTITRAALDKPERPS